MNKPYRSVWIPKMFSINFKSIRWTKLIRKKAKDRKVGHHSSFFPFIIPHIARQKIGYTLSGWSLLFPILYVRVIHILWTNVAPSDNISRERERRGGADKEGERDTRHAIPARADDKKMRPAALKALNSQYCVLDMLLVCCAARERRHDLLTWKSISSWRELPNPRGRERIDYPLNYRMPSVVLRH